MTPPYPSAALYKSLSNARCSGRSSAKGCRMALRPGPIRSLRVLIIVGCVVAATWSFAQSVDIGGTNPSWADQGEEGCADPAAPCAAIVSRFMETLKFGDKTELADLIVFPILRPSPLPSIEREEFLHRYHEVFDDALIGSILRAKLTDWVSVFQSNRRSTVEWLRSPLSDEQTLTMAISMQLIVDQVTLVQLEYSGKLSYVYYSSEYENEEIRRLSELRAALLAAERLGLHGSLLSFESPVLEWETDTYRIRVDALGNDNYRYAAWKIEAHRSSIPDLLLNNGRIMNHYSTSVCGVESGRGSGVSYGFTNGEYLYEVDAGYCYCAYDIDICNSELDLRVWRNPGHIATVPELESLYDYFDPRENGYKLTLHEPFENTANRIEQALHSEFHRARSAAADKP